MLAGLAPFLLLGLCSVPWVLLITPRYGARLAVTTVVAGAPLLVLAVLTVTGALPLPALTTLLSSTLALGILGLILLLRSGQELPSRARVLPWLAAGLGGIVWLSVLALALVLPGADPLSWAMSGDAANNTHNARLQLADNGIVADRGITVPLVSALLSVAVSLGRPESGASSLLAHDLLGLSTMFALMLAVASTLIGTVAASLLGRGRAVAAAVASLLGTTWLVAGLPIESGYLNAPVSISLLMLAWLAFLDARRAPVYSLVLQLGIGILVMMTWSPLVVVSLALVIATMVRSWVVVRVLHGRAAIPVVAAVVVILAITTTSLAPAFVSTSSVFATPGHGFPTTMGILGVAAVVAVAVRRRRLAPQQLDGVIAIVAGSLVATVVLLFIARENLDPLGSYYPAKLGWMLTLLVSAVALSLVLTLVNIRVAVVVLAASIGAASLGPASAREYNPVASPVMRILSGGVWHAGDHSAQLIIDHVGENAIYYRSGEPDEAFINFWLVDFGKGAISGDGALRDFAVAGYRELRDTGSYNPVSLDELCLLLPRLEPDATVYTADEGLRAQISETCSAPHTTVNSIGG